ncbi:hypothetical protein EMGBS12_12430 [Methylophilaceae bacterium]|nr:hypothetical protein EMGBS12_12430 [Methylophilaceae bacterium]
MIGQSSKESRSLWQKFISDNGLSSHSLLFVSDRLLDNLLRYI